MPQLEPLTRRKMRERRRMRRRRTTPQPIWTPPPNEQASEPYRRYI